MDVHGYPWFVASSCGLLFCVSSLFQGDYNLGNQTNKQTEKKTYCAPKQHNHIIWVQVTWHHWVSSSIITSSPDTSSLKPEKEET
jgi:hypothetical protein